MKSYLAVCAIYQDEAPYLAEWVEFHRLAGVEHFYLYDNGSTDDHLDVLGPYLDDGDVTLHHWPRYPGQNEAYIHCAVERRDEARWIAFLDLDEFLFSPTGPPVPEILRDYEQFVAVAVNWAVFGNSGHETKPEGLVLENYLRRAESDGDPNILVKTIADPRQVVRCRNPHYFFYRDRANPVDERFRPVPWARSESVSFERLRINHYISRSTEEFLRKLRKGKADQLAERTHGLSRYREQAAECNDVPDETILAYLPALRDALARRVPA